MHTPARPTGHRTAPVRGQHRAPPPPPHATTGQATGLFDPGLQTNTLRSNERALYSLQIQQVQAELVSARTARRHLEQQHEAGWWQRGGKAEKSDRLAAHFNHDAGAHEDEIEHEEHASQMRELAARLAALRAEHHEGQPDSLLRTFRETKQHNEVAAMAYRRKLSLQRKEDAAMMYHLKAELKANAVEFMTELTKKQACVLILQKKEKSLQQRLEGELRRSSSIERSATEQLAAVQEAAKERLAAAQAVHMAHEAELRQDLASKLKQLEEQVPGPIFGQKHGGALPCPLPCAQLRACWSCF